MRQEPELQVHQSKEPRYCHFVHPPPLCTVDEEHENFFDTRTGYKKRLIDVGELALSHAQQDCTTLMMALHVYTGCDTTSAFKRHGKVKRLKILSPLARLGETWHAPINLMTLHALLITSLIQTILSSFLWQISVKYH